MSDSNLRRWQSSKLVSTSTSQDERELSWSCAPMHNAQIEQFKFLRVVCAWTYLKKSLNIFDITYFYPNANNPEENRENSIFVNLTL